ncbi:APC family permease [Pontiella sulfatireligans]|uniref:Serine/threonine exchanger SteT n=1 Tax=Pontiella sulfatireligans TaxID=2750658 RepID=A0A6C2UNR2_9BACT|nr:amino acid permease [Pontiella sulfatireligans]VGO20911.1 Serine/threonine exchanger SteT [Pontiella sulfatireligans]
MKSPVKALSLFDSTCIIVGIIIGAGIYETTPMVAVCMGGWGGTMAAWLAGGLLALCGALCYAELATTYPSQGGDYVYLSRAYGPWAGFLFGWSQLAVIRPGDIALMAFVFARYASTLYAPVPNMGTFYAVGAVAVLTVINILGVRESKWTQNALTVVKAAGLLFIVAVGLAAPGAAHVPASGSITGGGLKLAMILVLFTYGGWNEMAYVAAEIRNPQKNIVRALVFGTVAVATLYLLANGAFLHALGYAGMAGSEAVAVDVVATRMPGVAARLIAVIICISALGAVNGLIFTGARISYALGTGHKVFQGLGKWHPKLGTPMAALALQGLLSMVIVLVAGSFVDTILYSAPAVWLFFLATGLSLFRLRKKEASIPRPFKAPLYPVVPILFCAACVFMLFSSASYAFAEKPVGLLALLSVMAASALFWRKADGTHFGS